MINKQGYPQCNASLLSQNTLTELDDSEIVLQLMDTLVFSFVFLCLW